MGSSGINAAAFTPAQPKTSPPSLSMSDATADAPIVDTPSYPTVNGWTADPAKFCAGLPGALSPLGEFDPIGLPRTFPFKKLSDSVKPKSPTDALPCLPPSVTWSRKNSTPSLVDPLVDPPTRTLRKCTMP